MDPSKVIGGVLSDHESLRIWNYLVRTSRWANDAEDVASETILRVLQNIRNGERIANLRAYANQVAKNIRHELQRARRQEDPLLSHSISCAWTGSTEREEQLDRCLTQCKKQCLSPAELHLIEAYYKSAERKAARRKSLASKAGISGNALRISVSKIRKKLEDCMRRCLDEEARKK